MSAGPRDLLERVQAEQLEYVRCQFIDLSGILRGRAVHRNHLPSILDRGIPFAQINNIVDIDDAESDLALGSQAGDFWAVPDPTTLHRVPHSRASGQMFVDLVAADGSPWPTCGRALVRRIDELVGRELGSISLGFEQEGYVLHKAGDRYQPVVRGKQMQPEMLDLLDGFVSDLSAALELFDVPVEKLTAEGGWAMFEVNFEQARPLEAAERYFRYKQAFRIVAREHGMVGSFMPKPFADGVGAGLHVHVSCLGRGGEDLFGDGGPGVELSDVGRWFVGGLLSHAPALIAFGSPSVNSFKRLQPGTWAPTHVAYGAGNRSAMIRIVQGRTDLAGAPPVRRLEVRSPDGTCNPYLLTAAVLAAGLDGVRRKLDPGPSADYDIAHPDAFGRSPRELPPAFPRSLDAALDGLEADDALADLLGPAVVDAYLKVKRIEWAKFMAYVTDWEYRYYAEFF
ncbi:MAG TPA: glutamine synthetase family protein [Candidatus Dormibacteraeota bacterium]